MAFFVFPGLGAISSMESPLEASWRIIQTWASRIAVEAAPGRLPASARSTARPVEAHVCVGGRLEPKKGGRGRI